MLQYQLKAEDAPVLRLLDAIIVQGLDAGASDIHLEPGTELGRIRYRIDGVLQQDRKIPMERHTALISCVKLMAGMDITERDHHTLVVNYCKASMDAAVSDTLQTVLLLKRSPEGK